MKIFMTSQKTKSFFLDINNSNPFKSKCLKLEKIFLKPKETNPLLIFLKTDMNTSQVFDFNSNTRLQFATYFAKQLDNDYLYFKPITDYIFFEPLPIVFNVEVVTYPVVDFEEIILFFTH